MVAQPGGAESPTADDRGRADTQATVRDHRAPPASHHQREQRIINAKIQWVKYGARGFRSSRNFVHAICFHCGGLAPEAPK